MAELEVRLQKLGVPRPPDLEDIVELTAQVEASEQAYAARLGTAHPPDALDPAGGEALPEPLPRPPSYIDPPWYSPPELGTPAKPAEHPWGGPVRFPPSSPSPAAGTAGPSGGGLPSATPSG
eukprot:14458637-Alexandrium_andersonii.AAC.1